MRKTNKPHTRQIRAGQTSQVPKKNIQPMKMNALPNSEMNKRSPRVVSRPKTPRRGEPPGLRYSHTPIREIHRPINKKNAIVARVQAIHVPNGDVHQSKSTKKNVCEKSSNILFVFLYATQSETARNVVADEINDYRSRDYR